MPVIPVTHDEPDIENIPEDTIHPAKITSIVAKDISWTKDGERKTATLLNWRWEIIEGEYKERAVFLTTNSDLELGGYRNRFRQVVETLLSSTIKPEDPPLNTDDLIGMVADISIKYRPDKRDPAIQYVEVGEVLPAGDTQFTPDEPPF